MEAMLTTMGVSAGTAATVTSVVQAVSIASSVMGAIQQGNASADNYNTQAGFSEYNAAVSRNQATAALAESTAAQAAQRRRARELLGEQRAGIAQSGTGFGGTNADLLEKSETLAELDALNLAYEGDTKAKGFESQAALDMASAAANRRNAGNAITSGYLSAGRSLLVGSASYGKGGKSLFPSDFAS